MGMAICKITQIPFSEDIDGSGYYLNGNLRHPISKDGINGIKQGKYNTKYEFIDNGVYIKKCHTDFFQIVGPYNEMFIGQKKSDDRHTCQEHNPQVCKRQDD